MTYEIGCLHLVPNVSLLLSLSFFSELGNHKGVSFRPKIGAKNGSTDFLKAITPPQHSLIKKGTLVSCSRTISCVNSRSILQNDLV